MARPQNSTPQNREPAKQASPRFRPARATLLISIQAFLLFPLLGQVATFQNFGEITAQNGLPRQSIRAIAQSSEGIMWLGLENSGLCRYDGHSFEIFNESSPPGSALSDDHVEAICPDDSGSIWIGTNRGLNRLHRDTGRIDWFKHDPAIPNSLPNDRVWALERDPSGRLWIGTDSGLSFLKTDASSFITVPPPHGRVPARVRDILIDRDARIWVMTTAETYSVDPQTLTATLLPYAANDQVPSETYCATQDAQGRIWLSTYSGHVVFDPRDNSIANFPILDASGAPRPGGGAVAATDPQGRVWFGTFAEGVIIIDPPTGEYWIREQPIPSEVDPQPFATRAMTADRDGRIWIGTKFHGLVFYHQAMETFAAWPSHNFAADDATAAALMSIAVDADNHVWVGTHREGVTRIDPANGARRHYPGPIQEDRTQCIELLPNGEVLLGGTNGIASLDRETGALRYAAVGSVMDILPSTDGELWLGAANGIHLLDLQTFQTRPAALWSDATNALLASLECRVLFLDREDHIWIGTRLESIYRLDRTSGEILSLEELASNSPPPSYEARSFLQTPDGPLWIATKSSGLIRFDPSSRQVRTYKTESGFASKAAYGLLQDADGYLWVSSDLGICRFDPATELANCFGTQHGLQADVFEPNAQAASSDGTFYFAGHNGLNAFRPEAVSNHGTRGDLVFTELRIRNQIRVRDRAHPPPLKLEHDENQIMISFSLLDYNSHGRNQYAYRMSRINEDWVDIGTRQTVSFNYLPPGEYTFEVRARTPESSWLQSRPATALAISIAAPFWQTPLFRAAAIAGICLLLLATFLALHYRSQLLRRRLERLVEERTHALQEANQQLTAQKSDVELSRQLIARSRDELEALVADRTRELALAKNQAEESDRLKSAFLANMSHEIRTPMNAIIGFSSMVGLETTSDVERREFTKIITNNCSSLLSLIDDILDLSAIEAGQLRIEKRPVDLDALLRGLAETFATQVAEKDPARFQLRIDLPNTDTPARIVTDPNRLRQVLANLLSNAIKFTAAGHVSISYHLDRPNALVRFAVEDTGIGIDPQHIDAIWERFRKIEDDRSALFRGNGLGLAITKNLVELLGGQIAVASQEGRGSRFTFSIPLVEPAPGEPPAPPETRRRPAAKQPIPTALPTVLIAEDEDSNFQFLSRQIPKNRARIVRARNGQEAVDLCHQELNTVVLVLMDIKMPLLDGRQAARQIKSFAPHLPIVANTAYASQEDRDSILSRDFDAYMSKPTSLEDIARVLEHYLDPQN